MSVLKVAKKDLGKDQAGQERCCSQGVATVDSQKDEGIIAMKGMKNISRTGEVALVGDLPGMLLRRCLEEVEGTGSSLWCTVCTLTQEMESLSATTATSAFLSCHCCDPAACAGVPAEVLWGPSSLQTGESEN